MKRNVSDPALQNIMDFMTPWWGRLLGIFIGYLIAGPAGSVFGVLIGNIIDKKVAENINNLDWTPFKLAPQDVQETFVVGLFRIIGHLAKLDGRISEQHIQIARHLMSEMKLGHFFKKRAMQYYNEGKTPYLDINHEVQIIKKISQHDRDLLALFAESIFRCAIRTPLYYEKKYKINDLFLQLHFRPPFPEIRRQQSRSEEQQSYGHANYQQHTHQQKTKTQTSKRKPLTDYQILGIAEGERADKIKKAYRKIMSQIHPDKLIARGASEQEIQQATEKAQRVRAAYERLKRSRGF